MLGSENHFFTQDKATLNLKRDYVWKLLTMKGYCNDAVAIYLRAYDYFSINPAEFDGATLVKDLCDIPDLDLDAMYHDYCYIIYNVASSVSMKFRADKLYAIGNEYKGKGKYPSWSRFIGLTLSGLGFIPFARLKRGKMTKEQKESFMCDYRTLIS